jgi:DNA-binding transcriptional LysR family regulator
MKHPCYVLRYMSVELAQWRLFLAVADEGSLGRAAARLGSDQPAVSRAVRRLELTVGTPLFSRGPTGTVLTAAGARLLEQARSLVAAADALDAAADAETRGAARALRVGALDFYPFTSALADAGRALRAHDPPVHIDLVELPWLSHMGAVLNHTIDVGFTLVLDHRLSAPDLLRSIPLRAEPQAYVLLPAGHPLANAEIIDPLALANEPLHLPARENNQAMYDLGLEMLADSGLAAPLLAPAAVSLAAVVQQIASGDGWTVAAGSIGRYPPAGTVARPLAHGAGREVHLEAIWHRDTDAIAVLALVDQLMGTPELTGAS